MLDILDGFTPDNFGFDLEDFPDFRVNPATGEQVQLEAIEFGVTCESRFCAMSIPTGIGKSLIAMCIAKYTGLRTVILTATKGLQNQYHDVFGKYGLVDIQGRMNYECADYAHLNCKSGASLGCACIGGKGCTYERARDKARNSQQVSANYAYWMTANDKAGGIERNQQEAEWKGENPVELLICDEGHVADAWLENYLNTKLYQPDVKRWANPKDVGEDFKVWKDIAGIAKIDLEADIETEKIKLLQAGRHKVTPKDVDNLHKLEALYQKYDRISSAHEDSWVVELREGTKYGRIWSFDVIWPGKYAERYLFCGVPRIIIMSATLRPKTLGLLGISKQDYSFKEWDRVFPANRNPIYSIPAKNEDGHEIRIDRRTSVMDMQSWASHIDAIVGGRLDRKGLIQTVSYDRQRFIMDHSGHAGIFVGNTADPDSDTAFEVANEFRLMTPPAVLVSPSFAMGWDFPMDQVEYIIICKVPFKPNQGKVMKARETRDRSYGPYVAMQELIQSCGRGMRSFDDRCEVIIIDGHLSWFLYQNQHLASGWFVKAVRKVGSIPVPPPKL